jgi:hypothetical protein
VAEAVQEFLETEMLALAQLQVSVVLVAVLVVAIPLVVQVVQQRIQMEPPIQVAQEPQVAEAVQEFLETEMLALAQLQVSVVLVAVEAAEQPLTLQQMVAQVALVAYLFTTRSNT